MFAMLAQDEKQELAQKSKGKQIMAKEKKSFLTPDWCAAVDAKSQSERNDILAQQYELLGQVYDRKRKDVELRAAQLVAERLNNIYKMASKEHKIEADKAKTANNHAALLDVMGKEYHNQLNKAEDPDLNNALSDVAELLVPYQEEIQALRERQSYIVRKKFDV